jgi:hypothetical protein
MNLNSYEGKTWFHKESMETLINLSLGSIFITLNLSKPPGSPTPENQIDHLRNLLYAAHKAIEKSDFQVEPFIRAFTDLSSRE